MQIWTELALILDTAQLCSVGAQCTGQMLRDMQQEVSKQRGVSPAKWHKSAWHPSLANCIIQNNAQPHSHTHTYPLRDTWRYLHVWPNFYGILITKAATAAAPPNPKACLAPTASGACRNREPRLHHTTKKDRKRPDKSPYRVKIVTPTRDECKFHIKVA